MLRLLVAALLLANGLFFVWSQGWLDAIVGVPARGEREPQRLHSQVRPELVRLWPDHAGLAVGDPSSAAATAASSPAATAASAVAADTAAGLPAPASGAAGPAPQGGSAPASSAVAATAGAPVCLEAGPFNPADLKAALASMDGKLPAGSWIQRQGAGAGEWMIYMGPYPDRDWIERKKAELGRIRGGVKVEDVNSPPELERGLSLGRFAGRPAADATLAQYRLRGIRTARVVRSGDGPPQAYLRVPQADGALAAQVAALPLRPPGRSFTPCPTAP